MGHWPNNGQIMLWSNIVGKSMKCELNWFWTVLNDETLLRTFAIRDRWNVFCVLLMEGIVQWKWTALEWYFWHWFCYRTTFGNRIREKLARKYACLVSRLLFCSAYCSKLIFDKRERNSGEISAFWPMIQILCKNIKKEHYESWKGLWHLKIRTQSTTILHLAIFIWQAIN